MATPVQAINNWAHRLAKRTQAHWCRWVNPRPAHRNRSWSQPAPRSAGLAAGAGLAFGGFGGNLCAHGRTMWVRLRAQPPGLTPGGYSLRPGWPGPVQCLYSATSKSDCVTMPTTLRCSSTTGNTRQGTLRFMNQLRQGRLRRGGENVGARAIWPTTTSGFASTGPVRLSST